MGTVKQNSVPKPNVVIDSFLMLFFAIEIVMIFYFLELDLLFMLGGLIILVAIMVHVVKYFAKLSGGFISRVFLKHLGNPLKKKTTMKKFCDQSWQFAIHTSMTIMELMILKDETWWQDITTLWNRESPTCAFPEHKYLTNLLYLTQIAIWVYTAFSCKFLEEIRKDYIVMMTHHVVTIGLVLWSFATGFLPVGVIVLFVHDVSDIPLDFLKMANYLKLEGLKGAFITEMTFVVLLFDWFYFRIYLFPTKLLQASFWGNREACCLPHEIYDLNVVFPYPGPPNWLFFNVLLGILWLLHIWWGFLIVRLLVGVLTKGVHESGKDEYEGTSSDSAKED